MSTVQSLTSKDVKATSLENQETVPVKKIVAKNIISNSQKHVINDPIEPKRVSKEYKNSLNVKSAIKAVGVFLFTLGGYFLIKKANVFSYFRRMDKESNSKSVNSEIMKISMEPEDALSLKTNLKKESIVKDPVVNQITQTYKNEDETVKFEETKVEEFKDLSEKKVEDRRSSSRRSISVQNPLLDQNIIVEKPFELTIDVNNVFISNSTGFFDAPDIPIWLNFSLLNPNPTFKGSYTTSAYSNGVVFLEDYVYLANGGSGLHIIDVSDPSNPTFKSSCDMLGVAEEVALAGNYAYVVNRDSLQIIDVSDPSNSTFKGWYDMPDSATGVAISGNYAYVADDYAGLQIIDVTDPSNPTFKGSYDVSMDASKVALLGNDACVVGGSSGLKIIDISDPSNPIFKSSYDMYDANGGIVISENYAYVACGVYGSDSLQIIDISDPARPTFKGSYDTPDSATGVAISGNYAYVADDNSGLQIIDISNPANPTFQCSYNTPGSARGVAISGNYAYVADASTDLLIVSLNPEKLKLFGTPNSLGTYSVDIKACNDADECITDSFDVIVGNNAPIVSNPLQNQTAIANTLFSYTFLNNTFSDPDEHFLTYTAKSSDNSSLPSWLNFNSTQRKFSGTTPTIPSTYPITVTADDDYEGSVSDVFNINIINDAPIVANKISDQKVKVNDIFSFKVSDVFQDPDGHELFFTSSLQNDNPLPNWLQFSTNHLFGIPTSSEILFLKVTADDNCTGIIFDQFILTVQDLLLPSIDIGVLDQKVFRNELLEFEVDTNEVFTSPESKPLSIGVSQLEKTFLPDWLAAVNLDPELVGTFATTGTTRDLVINDKYAYLGISDQGLRIVDISDPSVMPVIGSYEFETALGIAKSGNLVFVADGNNGLKVLDVGNPITPTLRWNYTSGDSSNNVAISGKHALVADGNNGLLVLDISTPNPTLTGSYTTEALDVKVFGNHAYIAAGVSGLEIVDITEKATPTLKGSYQNAVSVNSLAISGKYCYLANDNAGLKILDISNPNMPTLVGGIDTAGIARGISVSGKEVYLASDTEGIQIIDVSDPTNPTLKSSLDTTGTALKVEKSGNFLYVADGESGMGVVNVGKIKFSGTPGDNDMGIVTIELKANDGTNTVTDTFNIEVEKNVVEDIDLFLTSLAGWLSISLTTTACVCLSGASLILLTLITVCHKKAKAKKNRERLRERFTNIELEVDDKEYKYKDREIEINAIAKNIEEDVDLSDRDSIVMDVAHLIKEAKEIGKDLINPGVTATHLANIVRSEQFMHLDRESKLDILKAFEVYTGLALVASTVRRQTIYERVQEELVKQMQEVKSITPKNDYEMLFEIACIKEALKIIKSNERDAFELFQSVFKIKETGVLFAGFLRQYKKVTKQWYSKLVSMRYVSYEAKKEKQKLDNLQEMIPEKGEWKLMYGVVKLLGDIAINGETKEIREQAYFGAEGKLGLKDFVGYSSGKEKGQRAVRGEVAKVLYRLNKQGESVNEEDRERQVVGGRKALEERKNVEKDAAVKKVLERLEKDWIKEERKRNLIGGEEMVSSASTTSVKTQPKTEQQSKTPEQKNKISM